MSLFDRRYQVTATTGDVRADASMKRPSAGNSYFRVVVDIKNGRGAMESPDSATLYLRCLTAAGAEFGGGTRFYDDSAGSNPLDDSANGTFPHAGQYWVQQDTELSTGRFEGFLQVQSGDSEAPLTIEVAWEEQGRAQYASKRVVIGDAADLDTMSTNVDAVLVDTGTTIPATLGTPSTSIAADIAGVQSTADSIETDTQDLQSKIGTPASGTIATTIETVDTVVDAIYDDTDSALPTQIAGVESKVDTVDTNVDAILVDTGTTLPATLSTIDGKVDTVDSNIDLVLEDTGTTLPATLTTIEGKVDTVDTNVDAVLVDTGTTLPGILGSPAGAELATDIATIDTVVDGIQSDLDNGTDGLGALKTLIDTLQSSVDGVQNNTRFTAGVPTTIRIPASGTDAIELLANLYDSGGQMEDPDDSEIAIRIKQAAGTYITDRLYKEAALSNALDNMTDTTTWPSANGWRAMEREDVGKMFAFYKDDSGHSAEELVFEFGWEETGVEVYQARSVSVVDLVDTADAVWDEALDGHSTAGTSGKALTDIETDVTAILEDTGTTLPASIATVDGNVDSILADTNELQGDWTNGGRLDLILDELTTQGDTNEGKIDTVDTVVDALAVDLGDFSSQTNLQSLLAYLGELPDDANAPIGSILGYQLYTSASSGAGTFTLTQVTGGPAPVAADDIYNSMWFVPLSGARAMERIAVADYDGTTKVVTHTGGTIGDSTPLLLLWDKIGSPWDAVATGWGTTTGTVHSVIRLIGQSYLGDPTGDTLTSFLAKIGDQGDAATDQSILGLLGDPADAAVDLPDASASVFAALRQILDEVAGVAAGSGTQRTSFTAYPYAGGSVLSADPTTQEESAGQTTQSATYVIVDKVTINPPEGSNASINSIAATLAWTSQGTDGGGGGAGDTIWYIGPSSETQTEGNAPGGTAVTLTDALSMSTSKTTHRRSGVVPSSMIPATGGFHLLLCAKVDDVQDTATCTIWDETNVEVDYEV